jgi:hypothetical protein
VAVGAAAGVRTLLRPESHTVFPIFANAGQRWWRDQPLYGEQKPLDYFRYPPPCVPVFGAFAAAGLRGGGVLWTWLGLGVYASGLWRFRRDVLPADWSPRRESAFLALATAGALAGLWNAQSNALAVGLLLHGAAALARGRDRACAGWLAAAVWLKLTPLAPALLLCVLWPRRLAGRFALTLAAGALVPFLSRPPGVALRHYEDWVTRGRALAGERWPGFRDAWTAWLVARHVVTEATGPVPLTAPIDGPAYRAVQLATAAGCLAWCLALRKRGAGRRQLISRVLGVAAAWLMLFGPASEHATYVFLAPFLAAAVVDPGARTSARTLFAAAAALVLTLGWGAVSLRVAAVFPAVLAALPAGAALFAAGLALADRRRPARAILPPAELVARPEAVTSAAV